MTIPINPEMLALAYDYLCCTPPFNKWNLPSSEDINFAVIRKKDRYAHYQMRDGKHHIVLSNQYVGRHEMVMATMAHEMIHLHMSLACISTRNPHDKAFNKFADRVCKIHEFDRLNF